MTVPAHYDADPIDYMVRGDDYQRVRDLVVGVLIGRTLPINPPAPAEDIGVVHGARVRLRHAGDAIVFDTTDPADPKVLLIRRRHPPGPGLLACPGGFADTTEGATESLVRTAQRELGEEAGAGVAHALRNAPAPVLLPRRWMDGDIRRWTGGPTADGTQPGDLLAMTSAAAVFVVRAVPDSAVQAGDDASAVGWMSLRALTNAAFSLPAAHPALVREAAAAVGLEGALSDGFGRTAPLVRHGATELPGAEEQETPGRRRGP